MVCPEYQGETKCGFHSEFYKLTRVTIEKYCKDCYLSCNEFLENNKKDLEKVLSGPDFNWLKNSLSSSHEKPNLSSSPYEDIDYLKRESERA